MGTNTSKTRTTANAEAASHTACASRRPIQLCSRCRGAVGCRQEGMVLQGSPQGMPYAPPPVVIPQPMPVMPVAPVAPPRPADPYNCADGYANWQIGWSVGKKAWCCKVHGKGCPGQIGCATTSKPYDCLAGYANWMVGWSVGKKAWCCKNEGKGCPPAAGGCA